MFGAAFEINVHVFEIGGNRYIAQDYLAVRCTPIVLTGADGSV